MNTIILIVKDVFFLVKLKNDVLSLGYTPQVVSNADDLVIKLKAEPRPALLILDLMIRGFDWEAALGQAHTAGVLEGLPILAFGPHTDTNLRQRARAAGVKRVVGNSKLANLPELVSRYLAMPASVDGNEDSDE